MGKRRVKHSNSPRSPSLYRKPPPPPPSPPMQHKIDEFVPLLNKTLKEESESSPTAPRSHELLRGYLRKEIDSSLKTEQDRSLVTWEPISSSVFRGMNLSGKLAIIAHLKEPRRALVYLTRGARDANGKDIPENFRYQFVRLTPQTRNSGPTFHYDNQWMMCGSSKKGFWVVWKEYLLESPTCIENPRRAGQFPTNYICPPKDTLRICADYEKYVRGMERTPEKIHFSGYEQFNLFSEPTPDWKRVVLAMIEEKKKKLTETRYKKPYYNNAAKEEEEEEENGRGPPPPPPPPPRKFQRIEEEESEVEEEEEEEEETAITPENTNKWYPDTICLEGLNVITPASLEFRLLFDDLDPTTLFEGL